MTQKVVKPKISTASYKKNDSFSLAKNTREQIFNLASDVIFVADIKTGMLVDANLSAQKLIGKNLNQIRKMHQSLIHPKSESLKYKKIFKKHVQMGHGVLRDIYVINRKGKSVPFDVNIKIFKSRNNTYAVGIFRDATERQKIEKQIQISSDKYKTLSDSNSDFIFVVDRKYKILNLNKSATTLLDRSIDQLIGRSIRSIFPPNISRGYVASLNDVFKNERASIKESKMIVGDKTYYISTNLSPIRDSNGKVYAVLGDVRDLTTSKKIEEKLKESEERYRGIFETANDGIFLMDGKLFIDCNGTTIKMFGCSKKSDVVNHTPFDFSPIKQPDGKNSVEKGSLYIKNALNGKPQRFYWQHITKKGKTFDAEVSLNTLNLRGKKFIQAIVRDISQQREAEQKLAESQEKYKSVFDSVNDVIVLFNKEGFIIDINQDWKKITGYDPKMFIGKHFTELGNVIDPKRVRIMTPNYRKLLAGKMVYPDNIVIKTKNGKKIIFEVSISIRKINNVTVGLLAVLKDITNRISTEKNLKEVEKIAGLGSYDLDIVTGKWKSSVILDDIFGINNTYKKTVAGWVSIIHPEHRQMMFDYLSKEVIGKKQPFDKEYKIIRKSDKTERWMHGLGKLELNKKNQPVRMIGTIVDITDRKKIENELISQNIKFETIFDSVPDFIIYKSLDDKFLDVNKAFADWLGLPEEKIIGKTTFDMIKDKQVAKKTREDDLDIIRTGKPKFGVIRSFTSPFSGKLMWGMYSKMPFFDSNKKLIGTLTVTTDITKIVESERELKRVNDLIFDKSKRLEAVLENIGDYVFVVDRNYKITMMNKVACQLMDCSSNKAIGKYYSDVFKFIYEKDHTVNDQFIKSAMENGVITEMSNHTLLIKPNGEEMPIADSAAPIKDEHGNVTSCVIVFRDVTKERGIDKMKTEFVSIASHQLRTPLTGIKWFLELLLNQKIGALNEKQIDFINQVSLSNERMISLVSDLLSVSRIETGSEKFQISKRRIDIIPIISSVVLDNTVLAKEKNIKIINNVSGHDKFMVLADNDHIRQVFQNLITNAIKYSNENGKVEINCMHRSSDTMFSIRDYGVGIPLNQQSRVFEKFFRADNIITKETSGTGLGLYIAKAIVEGHGGNIWFESVEGKGTTFYFSIPQK